MHKAASKVLMRGESQVKVNRWGQICMKRGGPTVERRDGPSHSKAGAQGRSPHCTVVLSAEESPSITELWSKDWGSLPDGGGILFEPPTGQLHQRGACESRTICRVGFIHSPPDAGKSKHMEHCASLEIRNTFFSSPLQTARLTEMMSVVPKPRF